MGDKTGISWTQTHNPDGTVTPGATWNPVSGCTKLTAECKHCYVERDWHRLTHLPAYAGRKFTDVACHDDRLDQPLRWQRARRIFVCSTADLFHVDVPDEFLDRVFGIMALCPQHTFLVLTKRADRMQQYLSAPGRREAIAKATDRFPAKHPLDWVRADRREAFERGGDPNENTDWLPRWPLPNVHVGVTAGTQESANERLPLLMQTPAAKRWVSMEPLLEPVDLTNIAPPDLGDGVKYAGINVISRHNQSLRGVLDWCVVGGESGARNKARPMHPQWAIDIRDQCAEAGVPFYFKQQGEWILGRAATNDQRYNPKVWGCWVNIHDGKTHDGNTHDAFRDGDTNMLYVGRKAAGEMLDGREHKEMIHND